MGKRKQNRVMVYLDDDLSSWLEGKALEGYKKAALIRHVLYREMDAEKDAALSGGRAGVENDGTDSESEDGEGDGNE